MDRIINKIIVHCSATRAGVDFRASDIDAWHRERGFAEIGYHFVVLLDGTIEVGRAICREGAHAVWNNKNSIGVCYIGGCLVNDIPADTRTTAQKKALEKLVSELVSMYPTIRDIFGHSEVSNKACPCFDARSEYSYLLNSVLKK